MCSSDLHDEVAGGVELSHDVVERLCLGLRVLKKQAHRQPCKQWRKLVELAHATAEVPMLAHTHGQPATPTTVGKEFANVVHRLRQQLQCVNDATLLGKIAGATGSYQAHLAACPDADWPAFSEKFVTSLGLKWNKARLLTSSEVHAKCTNSIAVCSCAGGGPSSALAHASLM